MTTVEPTDMGTVNMLIKNSKGQYVRSDLNLSDGIEDVPNAVIAGRDLYITRNGDVDSQLVHIRQTNSAGALYGSEKRSELTADGTKSVTGDTLNGIKNDQVGYAYAKAAYKGDGTDKNLDKKVDGLSIELQIALNEEFETLQDIESGLKDTYSSDNLEKYSTVSDVTDGLKNLEQSVSGAVDNASDLAKKFALESTSKDTSEVPANLQD